MTVTNPEIYLSYAWGSSLTPEELKQESFNKELITLLEKKGFNLVYDKNQLGYKDSIRQFMERIGLGSFIILVISDKYLKSKYCLYELLMILENSNGKSRIFPIILPDAKIYNPVEKLGYYDYWDTLITQLNKQIKKLSDLSFVGEIQEELREYAEFKRIIVDFISITADMISTRIAADYALHIDDLLQSLEAQKAAYVQKQLNDQVHEITAKYNKRLQKSPDDSRLAQQEYFTRQHLAIMHLPLVAVKQILYGLGYLKSFKKDDIFNVKVAQAIERFQSSEGLAPVDGIYGPDTHRALGNAAKNAGLI